MTYSIDFRRHVFKVKALEGLNYEETATRFKIGKASLVRWNNEIEPKKKRNKPAVRLDMDALQRDILDYPDAYQYERGQRLGVSRTGIYWALKRLGVTYKKNTASSKSGQRETTLISRKDKKL
jgi:transposase